MDFKIQIHDGNGAFRFPTAWTDTHKKTINGLGINSALQHHISLHIYINYIPINKFYNLNNGVTYNAAHKQQDIAKMYDLIFMDPRAPGKNKTQYSKTGLYVYDTCAHTIRASSP
jgi:hypothetical protein